MRTGQILSAQAFAADVQSILLPPLLEHVGSYFILIPAFAVTVTLCPLKITRELLNVVCELNEQSSLFPFILLFALSIDADAVMSSGLWDLLQAVQLPSDAWSNKSRETFRARIGSHPDPTPASLTESSSLHELLEGVRDRAGGAFILARPGVLEHIGELIQIGQLPES
jgi:hypothetical protein